MLRVFEKEGAFFQECYRASASSEEEVCVSMLKGVSGVETGNLRRVAMLFFCAWLLRSLSQTENKQECQEDSGVRGGQREQSRNC